MHPCCFRLVLHPCCCLPAIQWWPRQLSTDFLWILVCSLRMVVVPWKARGILGVCSTAGQNFNKTWWLNIKDSYSACNSKDCLGNKSDILEIPQIIGVEQINFTDSPVRRRSLELWKVVHHLVVAAWSSDLLYDTRLELVHQLAQEDSIAKRLLECGLRETFASDGFNPLLSFLFLLNITLSSNLKQTNEWMI